MNRQLFKFLGFLLCLLHTADVLAKKGKSKKNPLDEFVEHPETFAGTPMLRTDVSGNHVLYPPPPSRRFQLKMLQVKALRSSVPASKRVNFHNYPVLAIFHTVSSNGDVSSFQLLARLSFPTVETKPYNMPSAKEIDPKRSYSDEKFERLQEYYSHMNSRMKEPHNAQERREILEVAARKLYAFIDTHMKDMKRLLFATDMALMSMVLLKLNKKMDTSEAKIKSTQAKIPFGLYTSPEFKCLGTSYYIASAHNQEDAQMILASERKPHCYTFRGAFAFIGFYHRHSETSYVGPHAEQFQAKDPSQGLYCHSDDNWSDAQCIYKINPREEFPESVEYEPKISYWCGPYRYFIPATTDVRCIFSIFSMNFVLRFGYDGVQYKSSDLTFMYQNGQVFYTDEPWAGMSCWNWACKWRHNQNQRGSEFFIN